MTSRYLALCSWSLQPENPSELLKKTFECDIHSIQLALVPCIENEAWQNAVTTLSEGGLTFASGMFETIGEDYSSLDSIARTGGVRPDETWPSTLERALKVAEFAGSMQLDLVTFHAGFLPEESCTERSKMLKRLEILGDVFGNHSVQIALETGQEHARNLDGILEELSHPMIGVNFDPANMILYDKGDPVESIQILSKWVKQVHIKDAIRSSVKGQWGTEVPVGKGEVDWNSFLDGVPEETNFVIERESGDNRIEDIKRAKQMILRVIQ